MSATGTRRARRWGRGRPAPPATRTSATFTRCGSPTRAFRSPSAPSTGRAGPRATSRFSRPRPDPGAAWPAGLKRPADGVARSAGLLVVVPAHRVAAPRPPIPVVHLHRLGGHLLLVGEVLLEHVLAVGGVGVLVADIQADAHGRVGIDVEDAAILDLAGEFVRRQLLERGLALRRIGGHELEAGGRHHVFLAGDLLLRVLAGGDGNTQ